MEGRPVGQRARSSSKAVRRVKEKFPMTVAQKKMKAHMHMCQWKGVCGAQTEAVLQYPPSLGNMAVSHTVLRQGLEQTLGFPPVLVAGSLLIFCEQSRLR